MKISVIMPVYNVASYIERGIKSVLNQTYTDFELIIVDDGSTDTSSMICDQMASEDRRIRVFHKENGGVSSARQFGLEKAIGEYIIHVDPDDWIEPKMLELLLKQIIREKADMVICDYIEEDLMGISSYRSQKQDIRDNNDLIIALFEGKILGCCWNKLVKRKRFLEYSISFPKLVWCEDLFVCVSLLKKPIKVTFLNKGLYHYIRNDKSLTKTENENAGIYALMIEEEFRKILKGSNLWKIFEKTEMPWIAYLVLYYKATTKRDFYERFRDLKDSKSINSMVRIALCNYNFALFLVKIRKMIHSLKS